MKKLSIKTVRECIVDFLIYQYNIQQSNVIELDRSKKELAEEFGIQRTSFSRELNKMKKEGLIDYDYKSIKIINSDLLFDLNF
ncbi:MAG: Crp/Fnr family transcriptional regulator [Paraclostridium sp.]